MISASRTRRAWALCNGRTHIISKQGPFSNFTLHIICILFSRHSLNVQIRDVLGRSQCIFIACQVSNEQVRRFYARVAGFNDLCVDRLTSDVNHASRAQINYRRTICVHPGLRAVNVRDYNGGDYNVIKATPTRVHCISQGLVQESRSKCRQGPKSFFRDFPRRPVNRFHIRYVFVVFLFYLSGDA